VKHRRPRTSLFANDPALTRVSNEAWAYSQTDLFEGQGDFMTPYEYYEAKHWAQECEDMAKAEAGYGEYHPVVAWETEQEAQREAWGLPAAWVA
jgi:hypothetical protein